MLYYTYKIKTRRTRYMNNKDFALGWNEDMSTEDTKNLVYWERNMLALAYATRSNNMFSAYMESIGVEDFSLPCGWYTHGEWDGWNRVISLDRGTVTFHVPDDFDLGKLSEIEENWNHHTTYEKWLGVMEYCGCDIDE
jgi:hypothetical protein